MLCGPPWLPSIVPVEAKASFITRRKSRSSVFDVIGVCERVFKQSQKFKQNSWMAWTATQLP
jgi:hypothetical protein